MQDPFKKSGELACLPSFFKLQQQQFHFFKGNIENHLFRHQMSDLSCLVNSNLWLQYFNPASWAVGFRLIETKGPSWPSYVKWEEKASRNWIKSVRATCTSISKESCHRCFIEGGGLRRYQVIINLALAVSLTKPTGRTFPYQFPFSVSQ